MLRPFPQALGSQTFIVGGGSAEAGLFPINIDSKAKTKMANRSRFSKVSKSIRVNEEEEGEEMCVSQNMFGFWCGICEEALTRDRKSISFLFFCCVERRDSTVPRVRFPLD